MKNTQHEPLIRAYLRKELSVSEQTHFEALLKTDPDFQKAYIKFCLQSEGAKELSMEDRFREMAESVKAEIGPIAEPRLTWWDHIQMAMYRPIYRGIASVAGLLLSGILLLFIWANTGAFDPAKKVAVRFLILPECSINNQEKAGVSSSTELAEMKAMLYRSKLFYCNNAMDSLQLNKDSYGVADYYIAQLQLKSQDWAGAGQNLAQCLSNKKFLQQFPNLCDPAEMRFNSLLARLADGENYSQIQAELPALLNDPATGQIVKDKAMALDDELTSPLRWFYLR